MTFDGGARPDQASLASDQASLASDQASLASDQASLAAAGAELDAVEAALVRLEDGSFENCEVCQAPIGLDRLTAQPLLTRCPEHT